MANLKLKKLILGVVENQLNANDPPCTKDIYEKLRNAGYSEAEAKEKIGAVVLTEIYDIMKEGQNFDEEKYKNALEEMLKQSIDYEDDYHIGTEWNKWDTLVQTGYACFGNRRIADALLYWRDAWDVFCSLMEQMSEIHTLHGLMDLLDYAYPIDEWLEDYEMELGDAEKYEERIAFCQKVLEMFDWQEGNDGYFRRAIGESLFQEGKIAEAYDYYERWLAEEPQDIIGIDGFAEILFANGDVEKAYDIVKGTIRNSSCHEMNEILFLRARCLADYLGKEDENLWYQQQLDEFRESVGGWNSDDDAILGGWFDESYDEFEEPKQMPIVKEKKIYPNDPCPCGSGKKYKKCCGK